MATRFLVVAGRTRARCLKCATLSDVSCVSCGAAPDAELLTDEVETPRCPICEADLALLASPAIDPGHATPEHEVDWGPLELVEAGGETPYRGGRPTRLRLTRARGGASHAAAAWAVLTAPSLVPALVGGWGFAAAWGGAVALFLAAQAPIVRLEVTADALITRRAGLRGGEQRVDATDVREVFWAGRGASCHVAVRTAGDEGPRVLFDGLTPDQARALEAKLTRLL